MKRIAIVCAAAVIAGGAGFAITDSIGSSGSEDRTEMPARPNGGPPGFDHGGGPPGMMGEDLATALAEELGISEERVAEALEAVMADRRP